MRLLADKILTNQNRGITNRLRIYFIALFLHGTWKYTSQKFIDSEWFVVEGSQSNRHTYEIWQRIVNYLFEGRNVTLTLCL